MRIRDCSTQYNVAHVIGSLNMGGAEKLLLSTVCELDRRKFRTIVCCFDSGVIFRDMEKNGIPVHVIPMRGVGFLTGTIRMARLFRKERIHIVHTHLPESNSVGRIAASLAGVPVCVSTLHNVFMEGRSQGFKVGVKQRIEKWTAQHCTDHLVSVSKAVFDSQRLHLRMKANNFSILPPFIMLSEFDAAVDPASANQKRQELKIGTDDPVIINVGSLSTKKGHRYLLEAAANVVREFPSVRFLLVGDGPLRGELQESAARAGLAGNVLFAGVRRDVRELLAISNLFASSSLYEGLPQVFLEAMAMGKPIVATRVGGVPEIIDDGKNGIIVPPENASALADGILSLLREPQHAYEMGKSGRGRIEQEYAAGVVVRRLEHLYENLLQRSGVAGCLF
jgi:glycosyltransferase involved in cell wall biosynthesis